MTFKCEKCGTLCGIDLSMEKADIEETRFENIGGNSIRFVDTHMVCPTCGEEMLALIEDED